MSQSRFTGKKITLFTLQVKSIGTLCKAWFALET